MFNLFKRRRNLQDELISVLRDEVVVLRAINATERERIDRLTEALARRGDTDLVMPSPLPLPVMPAVRPSNPWKDPNPVTATWPQEKKQ